MLFLLSVCLFSDPRIAGMDQGDVNAIRGILAAQVQAWNQGDLDGFMRGYLANETLVFVGSKGPRYGWQAALDGYKQSYPDRETMGKLSFELLVIRGTGADSAYVVGKWHLAREQREDAQGHFLLVWQRIDSQWLIVADHSS